MPRTRTLVAALAVAVGCDSTPTDRPEPARPAAADSVPTRGNPDVRTGTPRPDPKRLTYDPDTLTLTVYELPGGPAQWMVRTGGQRAGVPIAHTHRFPMPVKAEAVSVFYAVPNGGTSDPVTLQDILEAHRPPAIH